MKKFVCEMCNSSDLIKQDGLYVCQYCGTKYTTEEARKLLIDGVVEVQGTVRIDTTDELKKLYQAARNARETSDDESALRHYESISAKDPDSWEALFYLVILKTNSIKNSEIRSSANSVSLCLPKVFALINATIDDEDKKKEAVNEVIEQCLTTATWLTSASHSFYKSMVKGNGLMAVTGLFGAISSAGSTLTELGADNERCVDIANIMCYCGNGIEEEFDMNDPDYRNFAVWSWQQMLDFHDDYSKFHSTQVLFDQESVTRFNNKIAQYTADERNAQEKKNAENGVAVLTVKRNQTALTNQTNKLNRVECRLSNGLKFELGLGQTVQHTIPLGKYTMTYEFWGQSLVPAKNKSTPEFVVDGNVYVELNPDPTWGGFKATIIKGR